MQLKLHKFATIPIVILKKNRLFETCVIVKRTCVSIFSKLGVSTRSIIIVHTNVFAKNCKLHKFGCIDNLRHASYIVKRTCISIFRKIGLVDQSKPCTQIYLQKIASCINLQLPIVILKTSII